MKINKNAMTTSRRSFLRLSAGAATTAMQKTLTGLSIDTFGLPHEDQEIIRLNSNENAYGPSAKVTDSIRVAVARANRYPRLEYCALSERVANLHHVTSDQILFGCGSTEVLRMAAFAFLDHGKQLIHALPTYEAIEHYGRAAGAEIVSVRLTPTFAHNLDGMLARVDASTTLLYICNPNNPTGTLTPRRDLEEFIRKLPASAFVVIDEAYHHYAGASGMYASFIDRPIDDERVIVIRTFSKAYGLAGLRLGYAVGSPKIIQGIRKFGTEDNINAIATQAAAAAVADTDGMNDSIRRNVDDRQEFVNQAMARALKPIDSHANFIMMNTFHPGDELAEHFRKNKILIGHGFPSMDTYIRVSLGRPEEMQAFWRVWDMLPYAKNVMSH
jgi:histidinol-phosphate aminotransferase